MKKKKFRKQSNYYSSDSSLTESIESKRKKKKKDKNESLNNSLNEDNEQIINLPKLSKKKSNKPKKKI